MANPMKAASQGQGPILFAGSGSTESQTSGGAKRGRESKRARYLENIWLKSDPFATPVAEQELNLSAAALKHEDQPTVPVFYGYYTPPAMDTPNGRDLIAVLRDDNVAQIFGVHGSGKTMLRLMLDESCRTVRNETLAVTYEMAGDVGQPLSWTEHQERMAEALAVDCFVQVVEQFHTLVDHLLPEQVAAMGRQLSRGGRALQRVARRIIGEPEPEVIVGLSAYWPALRRAPVKYVSSSPRLREFLDGALAAADEFVERDMYSAVADCRIWGFTRLFLLIDGVDSRKRAVDEMLALIDPLWRRQANWERQNIFAKWFLPEELFTPLQVDHFLPSPNLRFPPFTAIIKWDELTFRNLLHKRFEAADSSLYSLDDLIGPDFTGSLEEIVLRANQEAATPETPRKLLEIMSALIDTHASRAPEEKFIVAQDLQEVAAYRGIRLDARPEA